MIIAFPTPQRAISHRLGITHCGSLRKSGESIPNQPRNRATQPVLPLR